MLAALLLSCTAIDGDTLRCNGERYRLLAIDAPEMSHCRKGRVCAPGDPIASKAHLAEMISGRKVAMTVVGKDRYGRSLVVARVGRTDLSCAMIRAGHAVYVKRWDNGGRVNSICESSTRR